MPIWIAQNQYTSKVVSDLRTICPDPGLSVDPAGRVAYVQTQSGVGQNGIAFLNSPTQLRTVSIRGESPAWSARPIPGMTLGEIGGVALYDQYPGTRIVDIVYDASDCNGKGFVTIDPQGVLISLPSDALLFHELAHAVHMIEGTYNPSNPEPSAIVERTATEGMVAANSLRIAEKRPADGWSDDAGAGCSPGCSPGCFAGSEGSPAAAYPASPGR